MGLEAATYISQLNSSNPVGGADAYSTADDHLRLIKAALLATFPNFTAAALTPTQADLNTLLGAAGAGLTPTLFGYLVGTTSNIQTQLNAKLSTANDTVGNANLTNMADSTIKGRASGAGTGDPTDLTAAQVLTILLGVDGSGSGLDADLLDGQQASAFAAASHAHAATDITSGLLAIARGGTNAGDVATARTNLGLGALAVLATINNSNWSGTALAVGNGGTGSTTAAGARTNLGVTATGGDTTYNFRSNNLSDVVSAASARTNLGVTATGADTTYAYRANNLSDLANAATARTNLGVGSMATRAVTIDTGNPTGGVDGDIWLKYTP